MENGSTRAFHERRHTVWWRLFWFVAGAGVNYLLIATPFKWLKTHTNLSIWAISGGSIGFSACFFFLWNYFVNFQTGIRKREALPRYITAVILMWALSSVTLSLLARSGSHHVIGLAGGSLDLDIIATQFFLAGLKFPLYHKWAFPLPKKEIMPTD